MFAAGYEHLARDRADRLRREADEARLARVARDARPRSSRPSRLDHLLSAIGITTRSVRVPPAPTPHRSRPGEARL
jgi:hypothetical protein